MAPGGRKTALMCGATIRFGTRTTLKLSEVKEQIVISPNNYGQITLTCLQKNATLESLLNVLSWAM
jgi:hypothetical protein